LSKTGNKDISGLTVQNRAAVTDETAAAPVPIPEQAPILKAIAESRVVLYIIFPADDLMDSLFKIFSSLIIDI
jgi:hypothetical protein